MQIIQHTIDNEEKTCILLGDESLLPPKHIMQGEKKKGILYLDGRKEDWIWEGLCTIDGSRYVYFSRHDIESFDLIADKYRGKALYFVRLLASLLAEEKEDFTSPLVGLLTTWRVFIVEGRGLLILPPDLGDLISIYMDDDEKYRCHGCYIKNDTEAGFSLIRQFAQFLYFALTGSRPYEKQEVRDAGYHEIPLKIFRPALFPDLDERTVGFISFVLHAKEREQRDIMGNRNCVENLSWFVSRTQDIDWTVPALSNEELKAKADEVSSAPEVASLMAGIARKAKRRNFWRVKGTIITTAAIVAVILGAILASYVSNLLEPPYTKDMNQEEMIYAFYQAQNALSVDQMTDALSGCDAPQETEVISLYVTTMTRYAYEGQSPAVPADQWTAQGCPPIQLSQFVYGVSDLAVSQTGENSWHVEGNYYTPYPYSEEETVAEDQIPADKVVCYLYSMSQDFSFTWNDRGWWNITSISQINVEYKDTLFIDTAEPPLPVQESTAAPASV